MIEARGDDRGWRSGHAWRRRRLVIGAALIMVSAAPGLTLAETAVNPIVDLTEWYIMGITAREEGDDSAYAADMLAALAIEPGHPLLMRHVARARASQGDPTVALDWLSRVVETGVDLRIEEDPYFESLRGTPALETLVARMKALRAPLGRSEVAFRIPQRDLFPEGLAHDPVDDVFYLGSIHRRMILRIDGSGGITSFVSEGDEGLLGVLGLRVDPERRTLWANATHMPEMRGAEEGKLGAAGVFAYDLETGGLVARHLVEPDDTIHNFNDLVVTREGDVYITDADAGALYVIRTGEDRLRTFLEPGVLDGPNGLVLTPDERHLLVANYTIGISRITLATREHELLAHPPEVTVVGIDGLYRVDDRLIAVQNMLGLDRVAAFTMNAAWDRIESQTVLDAHHPSLEDPTTGAVVGDWFYYIANSQLPRMTDGVPPPIEELTETFILRVPLNPEDEDQ